MSLCNTNKIGFKHPQKKNHCRKVHTLTIGQFEELRRQRRKVRMAERVLGANPIVRIQLQEHAGDHFALDDVVQPREAVAELARSVETWCVRNSVRWGIWTTRLG